ncbi:MAG: 4Fe-4S dicluster domain-containing protein [Oscillospiraceae bacterium]|nr:4Fe-4S dicluster domain-containing protein [Oscillospiraceae bacterium]
MERQTKIFDTKTQMLKCSVLEKVARHAWRDDLLENILSIPKEIIPAGSEPSMRCCVYKERAILAERVHHAMGGDRSSRNVISVINIACDDCPSSGYTVTDVCRGCLAHFCAEVCPRGAISYDEQHKAHIDKEKCINCGRCAQACPYSAIINRSRPCEDACKIKAVSMAPDGSSKIDDEKCIACGACAYHCPFGAITDKSFIINVIDMIKKSEGNSKYKVFAVVAPAIASQFSYAKIGQVIRGLKELGFSEVVEVALGADIVAFEECGELVEKGMLTSSCCPAFVSYIEKHIPEMLSYVSHNPSPMGAIGKRLKTENPGCKVVFIGPCTAKKMEFQKPELRPFIDSVMTFEELQALFDSRDIDLASLEEEPLDDASGFGRIFARSGGLSEAVAQGLKERGFEDFECRPVVCSGIAECQKALLLASKGKLDGNFIEGMACVGGCVNGAGCLNHGEKNRLSVDKHGASAAKQSICGSLEALAAERKKEPAGV